MRPLLFSVLRTNDVSVAVDGKVVATTRSH
jgi:hypothetical protein